MVGSGNGVGMFGTVKALIKLQQEQDPRQSENQQLWLLKEQEKEEE